MKPKVYTYENVEKQQLFFRGYTQRYNEHLVENIPCTQVRGSKIEALNDAKKLIKKSRGN